ncbi:hypothetical protein AB0M43_24895 [Longispora sp. NPDC051575]|uniref:hypothetical protein n=1 Tax=Longispora sp. NPDC051575 TaxID=3154943 RepID=UPI00341A1732
MHGIQIVGWVFSALTALVLIAGLIFAGVTLRRNGRASVLALVACVVLLLGSLVYAFGYQVTYSSEGGYMAVSGLGGLLHLIGIVLLLAAALFPGKPGAPKPDGWGPSQQGPGGWSPQPPDHGGGWNPQAQQVPGQVPGQGGWAPQQEQGWSPQGGWGPAAPGGYEPGVQQQGGPGFQAGTAPQSGPPYQQPQQPGQPYQQPYPPQ